jgi:hypothetical protein
MGGSSAWLRPHRQMPGQTGQGIRLWKNRERAHFQINGKIIATRFWAHNADLNIQPAQDSARAPSRQKPFNPLVTLIALPTINFTNAPERANFDGSS